MDKTFKLIGMVVVGLILFPIALKIVFGVLGIALGLTGLVIKLSILAGVLYLLYLGYQKLTASS